MAHDEHFKEECLHCWCVQTSLRAELRVLQQGRRVQHCSKFGQTTCIPVRIPFQTPFQTDPDPIQNKIS